jgi:hypothetical protein
MNNLREWCIARIDELIPEPFKKPNSAVMVQKHILLSIRQALATPTFSGGEKIDVHKEVTDFLKRKEESENISTEQKEYCECKNPELNKFPRCEHEAKDELASGCIWCELSLAEGRIEKLEKAIRHINKER